MFHYMFELTSPISLPCFFEKQATSAPAASIERNSTETIDMFEILSEQERSDIALDVDASWLQNDTFDYGDGLTSHLETNIV